MKNYEVGQVWKNDNGDTIVIMTCDLKVNATDPVAEYIKFPIGRKYRGPHRSLKRVYPHYVKMVYEK